MIQDSGKRREFETGAVRDIQDGKGRFDLAPLIEMSYVIEDDIMILVGKFIQNGNKGYLKDALIKYTELINFGNQFNTQQAIADIFLEVGVHYEEGCKKYGERNWEKGIPLHCFIDSAIRHYLKWCRGDTDERHDRAFTWNILGAIWTINNKPELIDIGFKDNGKSTDNIKVIE